MKEIRIKIEHDMAKHEEVAILEKLHESFKGTQNYLENLFTVKMVGWALREIQNDFSCDIYEHLTDAQDETQDLRKQLYSAEQERNNLLKKLKEAEAEISNLTENIKLLRNEIAQGDQNLEDWKQKAMNHQDRANGFQKQIIELKARLYDLEHPTT